MQLNQLKKPEPLKLVPPPEPDERVDDITVDAEVVDDDTETAIDLSNALDLLRRSQGIIGFLYQMEEESRDSYITPKALEKIGNLSEEIRDFLGDFS